jgi:hypothetical protein
MFAFLIDTQLRRKNKEFRKEPVACQMKSALSGESLLHMEMQKKACGFVISEKSVTAAYWVLELFCIA